MLFQFPLCLEDNQTLSALWFLTHVMRYSQMLLKTSMILIVPKLMSLWTEMTIDMCLIQMVLELVLIIEVLATELAIRMVEYDIPILIEVTLLLMLLQRILIIQCLLIQYTCLAFHTSVAKSIINHLIFITTRIYSAVPLGVSSTAANSPNSVSTPCS